MKTLAKILLFLCVISNYARSQTNSAPTNTVQLTVEGKAIRAVLFQYQTALDNSVVRVSPNHYSLSYARLMTNFVAIKTDDCPKDFRMAWIDLNEAIHERTMIHGSTGELVELFANPPKGIATANQKADESNQAEIKILRAVSEIKKLAIKYDAHY